jgi:hypothetical protein
MIGPGSARDSVRVRYSIKMAVHTCLGPRREDMVLQTYEVIFDSEKKRPISPVPNVKWRNIAGISAPIWWSAVERFVLRGSRQECERAAR